MKRIITFVSITALALSLYDINYVQASNIVLNRKVFLEKQERSISIPELIDIFTRRYTRWENGESVVVVTRELSSIEHKRFLQEHLGITPYQYRARLQRNIYQGIASPPFEVKTEEELIDKVALTPGAIGYVYNLALYRDNNQLVIVDVTP